MVRFSPQPSDATDCFLLAMTAKIQAIHLARRAIVYVRQSTTAQVRENKESTARQYALVERARELGWSGDAIITIDEDLGQSGATTEGRPGFRRLCETLAHGDAGAVFALEVSRLARCSQDWQRLLALCAVAQVVVGDEHTIYDPRCGDDKLLLDFKGTMSEAELRWLSLRLRGAQNAKARRGALHFNAPTGYIWTGEGFEMDPDLAVRRAIRTIFERFEVEPTVGALLRWAHRRGFQVPTRRSFADGTMELDWNPICRSRLGEILKNPIYAGAYAYGRRSEKKALIQGQIRTVRNTMEPEEWVALIREAHEGYISWESYLANLDKLRANAARRPSSGAPREGLALLTGMLLCGRCGRPMTIGYLGQGGKRWMYVCRGDQDRGAKACWTVSGMAIDAAVEQLFLRMVIPAELDLTLAVEHEVEAMWITHLLN